MEADRIFEKIIRHFEEDLPFAIYHKPNSKKIVGVFQHDDTLHKIENFKEQGFAFASFDGDSIFVIPQNQSQVLTVDYDAVDVLTMGDVSEQIQNQTVQSDYIKRVKKAIEAIRNGDFGKVVLSRKETIPVPDFKLDIVFQKLIKEYPTAFGYCFFHPKIGLWLGSFSEQLIRVKNQKLHTMSVAGTQLNIEGKPIVWGEKEQAEQQFVTDFIVESLREHTVDSKISEPYSMQAGQLLHIKTDIEATLNEPSNLKEVLAILHPTPAVCGFPKQKAREYILNHEGYDRGFYAGFLGEFNCDFESRENSTELYVNLRCLQVEDYREPGKTKAALYVGGGITKDSIPEKEWEETVNKTKTIKKILH